MGSEFELKYKAAPEIQEALLAELSGKQQHFEMQTTYYDTPSRQLSARHWTLRQRMENSISICTLKTPGIDGVRGEFETECDEIRKAIPVLCKLSNESELAQLAASGLQEVCGARFHRTAVTVALEGAVAEVALDRGILLGGGKELPFCEIEVELKEGDRSAVIAYAALLADRFGLQPEPLSKFRRASDLAGGISDDRI